MDEKRNSRLGIAIAASLGLHLFVLVCAEVTSGPPRAKYTAAPPVEISRIVAEGSPLPSGQGESSFNSRPSVASPGFGQKYNLDAGVPSNIPIPPQQPTTTSQSNQTQPPPQQSQPQTPVNSPESFPVYGSQPNRTPPTPRDQAPRQEPVKPTSSVEGNSPPSNASRASIAGNQGKTRSRGPNRIAFPEYTVEPQVPASLIVSGVESSVDVSVEIAADGAHSERIVRSSGSSQVDDLVLAALKQWKWDPAAREGNPIASTQNFLFKFKPR